MNHFYGEGELRRQVLFDINAEIHDGEIIIVTGPSGSGKTTLLTLIGALRSVQEGEMSVLGRELAGSDEFELAEVRKRIGYIFQAHNLLETLTAQQNVQVALQLHPELDRQTVEARAAEALEAVGLGSRLTSHPSQLSGGERQRVAVARALAGRPELVLADEPTASLDRQTGRQIIELLRRLAKKDRVTVVLVSHDNRILDIADRILALEDGRLSSLMSSVASQTSDMMRLLVEETRRGHLTERITGMNPQEFHECLTEITAETARLVDVINLVQGNAFEGIEEQVVKSLIVKLAEVLGAEQASIYFLDPDDTALRRYQLNSNGQLKMALVNEIKGIAGHVMNSGEPVIAADISHAPGYDASIDGDDNLSVLVAPVSDSNDQVFAVVQLKGKVDTAIFDEDDQTQLLEFTQALALILESWWRMGCACRRGAIGHQMPCCAP